MNAGMLRNKITIQKKSITTDEIEQQIESWFDYFTCYAYVNNLSGSEYWAAAQQHSENTVVFTVRYCRKLANMTSQDYRIIFRGNIYDINFVDNVMYENTTLKFKAKLGGHYELGR